MLKYSLFGLLLVAITVVIHAFGTTWLLRQLGRRYEKVVGPYKQTTSAWFLVSTVVFKGESTGRLSTDYGNQTKNVAFRDLIVDRQFFEPLALRKEV